MLAEELHIRDPFIFILNNKYYLTGTHYGEYDNAIYIYSSNDLISFKEEKHIIIDGEFDRHTSWAPEIHEYNGSFFIFVSLKKKNGKRGTYVLKSNVLLGDYAFVSDKPITPENWMCLDATLFIDNDGTPYTIFCREWLEVKTGEIYIAKLNKTLSSLISEPVLLFKANEPEWAFPIYGNGYVTDGPFVWFEDNKYHMIWSSFCKRNSILSSFKNDEQKEYALSHITSANLFGPWKQEKTPLIDNNAGHGMTFTKDGARYIALHYPNTPSGSERLKLVKFDSKNNMIYEKKKIIFDTDIGDDIDDAFALLVLLNNEDVDLLGVTTVFRNSVDRAKMAKYIINLSKKNIECYAGIDTPINQDIDLLNPDYIKKKECLNSKGKYILPQWDDVLEQCTINELNAVDFIINTIHKYPGEVTLLATGPFTNVALALQKDPSIIKEVKEIRIMGGRVYPSAPVEWNIKCDPEAAKIMYESGANLSCVGINVTEKCILSYDFIKKLRASNNEIITFLVKSMDAWFKHYERNDPTMHDPIAACSLFENIISWDNVSIDVALEGNQRGLTNIIPNCENKIKVAKAINTNLFNDIFLKYIKL